MPSPAAPYPVVLVGAHGFGRNHLTRLAALQQSGRVRLAGVVDVRPLDDEGCVLARDALVGADAEQVIHAVGPAVVVVATPIHTHVDLALLAFRAGAHVLLEKPPTPTLADFDRLVAAQAEAGLACQVGFQAFGSAAVDALAALVPGGGLGEVTHIGFAGAWSRDDAYYVRAAWAGRRQVDGVPVMDGALTNPFAHGVALALGLAEPVRVVEVETYHAFPIEADDTACARIVSAHGIPIAISVTLCARQSVAPYVEVRGTAGRAVLWYTEDRLRTVEGERTYGRVALIDNLLDHLDEPLVPLRAPLSRARSFMQVVEAIRVSPPATPIDERHQEMTGEGPTRRRIVTGIDEVVPRCAASGQLYSELGVEWASAEPFRWEPGESGS